MRKMLDLYSVRMRAAQGGDHRQGGRHISGAERLVPQGEVTAVTADLLERAQRHERGEADYINFTVEKMAASQILFLTALPITTIETHTYEEGRRYAGDLLKHIGIDEQIVERAITLLARTAYQMRGAILLDIHTGQRLEQDVLRGVRVSRMDVDFPQRHDYLQGLSAAGLTGEHIWEALVLATKVCSAPGMVAELCWSDDPYYTAGYVASPKYGYVRMGHLKPYGLAQGGRIFFFDTQQTTRAKVLYYLERQPVLIQSAEYIRGPMSWEDFLAAGGNQR